MEETDDEVPMLHREPDKMKSRGGFFCKDPTSGSARSDDEVMEYRPMSVKLTILTALVFVFSLVFLIVFLIIPLFSNIHHSSMANGTMQEEHIMEHGHGHHSGMSHDDHDGMNDAGHDDMTDGADSQESSNSSTKKKMLEDKELARNTYILKRISEFCPCLERAIGNERSSTEEAEVTSPKPLNLNMIEDCLKSCLAKAAAPPHE